MFRPSPFYLPSGLSAAQTIYFLVRGQSDHGPVEFAVANRVALHTLDHSIEIAVKRQGIVGFVRGEVRGLSKPKFMAMTAPKSPLLAAA